MPPELDFDEWYRTELQPHAETLKGWLLVRYPTLTDVENVVQDCLLRAYRARACVVR